MGDLREQIESDLATTLEGDYGLPITLIAPDGVVYEETGQVLYNSLDKEGILTGNPVAVLRISSLSRVPVAGENWAVRIPQNPGDTTLVTYILDKAPEHCRSIGFIKLYLTKTIQS